MSALPAATSATRTSAVASTPPNDLRSLYPREFFNAVGGDLETLPALNRIESHIFWNLYHLKNVPQVQALFTQATETQTSQLVRGIDGANRPYLFVAMPNGKLVLFQPLRQANQGEFNQIHQWRQTNGSEEEITGGSVKASQQHCLAIIEDTFSGLDCSNRLSYLVEEPFLASHYDMPLAE